MSIGGYEVVSFRSCKVPQWRIYSLNSFEGMEGEDELGIWDPGDVLLC